MSEIVAEGIIEARTLRQFLDTIDTLVSEAKIHFDDEGLTARFVDPANVCMVNRAHLSTRAFESYDAPGRVTIGTNVERLIKRLKPADPSALVSIRVDMETRRLQIDYGRAHQTLALIDPESIRKEPDTENIEFTNWVTVEGSGFDEALTLAGIISDHIWLRADPDDRSVTVFAQGDTDDGDYTFEESDVLDGKVTEATEGVYSLDYLEDLAKAIPGDAELTLRFDEEWPLRMEWTAAEDTLDVTATLAPRIVRE